MENFLSAQIFMGLISVRVACPRKLVSYKNLYVYGKCCIYFHLPSNQLTFKFKSSPEAKHESPFGIDVEQCVVEY